MVKPSHLTLHKRKTNTDNYVQMLFDSDLLTAALLGRPLSSSARQHEEKVD